MNERQKSLLKTIVSQYIKTAEPISSKLIAEAGRFDLSSATIRNEMAELEDQGYIFHPHTSAGRMPTEKGYKFYIENFLLESKLAKKDQEVIEKTLKYFSGTEIQVLKDLARQISELCHNAVFIAFSDRDFYYTGLSNLFSQPEFFEHQLIHHITKVIDHLDEVMGQIYQEIDQEVKISIGSENPFARDCSSVIARYQNKNNTGLLGIIGPTRMDYQNNFSLIKCSQELINQVS
ncbi:MAG: hypothetical protein WCX71_04165 [Candidatus Buchananbacteria bacterium]